MQVSDTAWEEFKRMVADLDKPDDMFFEAKSEPVDMTQHIPASLQSGYRHFYEGDKTISIRLTFKVDAQTQIDAEIAKLDSST